MRAMTSSSPYFEDRKRMASIYRAGQELILTQTMESLAKLIQGIVGEDVYATDSRVLTTTHANIDPKLVGNLNDMLDAEGEPLDQDTVLGLILIHELNEPTSKWYEYLCQSKTLTTPQECKDMLGYGSIDLF
jgi:hypothetical protein